MFTESDPSICDLPPINDRRMEGRVETAATNHIRKSLVDLMLYYERRTVDEEKKMGLSSVVDLKNLR